LRPSFDPGQESKRDANSLSHRIRAEIHEVVGGGLLPGVIRLSGAARRPA
jgi:hypothetical protein